MPRPNFFNENSGRSFPFIRDSLNVSSDPDALDKLPTTAIVDFGSIMGVSANYIETSSQVTLDRIVRSGGKFYFYFKTDASDASTHWLVFSRDVGERDYVTEYVDATLLDDTDEQSLSLSAFEASVSIAEPCDVSPVWSGYLTTGDLTDLEEFIPDGTTKFQGDPVVEPALIKNQGAAFVRSINVANADRTRADTPDECRDLIWKVTPDDVYVREVCLTGRLRFEEGYNAAIAQSPSENLIRINAGVGVGAGEVCTEVPVFDGELPPFGGTNLDGADSCSEVIRSINGAGGRIVQLLAGAGVTISPDTVNNKININVDLNSLKVCIDFDDPVEESECSFSADDALSCGPV